MSGDHPRRAAEDVPSPPAAIRPELPRSPLVDPQQAPRGVKAVLSRPADKILDWYAMQSKTLRVGLLGSIGAFCFLGVVAAASNALTPAPTVSVWATMPSASATSLPVVVSGSTPSVRSAPSMTGAPSGAILPSASQATTAATQKTSARTPTPTPTRTKATSTAAPSTTTAHPTTASPTTTTEPTTAPPQTDPPATAPATSG